MYSLMKIIISQPFKQVINCKSIGNLIFLLRLNLSSHFLISSTFLNFLSNKMYYI